jgi:hypothetical protein
MKRILAALAALLFLLPAFVQAAPHLRHAAAATSAVCRAGSVRLHSGLCCPRSGVTRRGGCVSGAIRPDIVPPPLAYCYGGAPRDALGRCPVPACMHGYSRDRFGQCQRIATCANGRTPTALGHCPPDIATPRLSLNRACPGGGFADADGNCPTLYLCSNGYAPVAGRCPRGSALSLTRPASITRASSVPHSPAIATPRVETPFLAHSQIARPLTPQLHAPTVARPEVVVPHFAPAPTIARPVAPPAPVFAPHFPGGLGAPHTP